MALNLTRRNFLKTASIAAASIPLAKVTARAETGLKKSPPVPKGSHRDTQTVTGGVCEICFWRCQLVGKLRDNRLVKLEGNPKSIDNGQAVCARGNAGIRLLYDPDRLKYPMKNIGERGAPKWQRISWEEALDICAEKFSGIIEKYGAQGISMFPHGASAKYPQHFFEYTIGTPNISMASFFQCRGARDVSYLATLEMTPGEHVDMANAKVIFMTGSHLGENIHLSHMKRYVRGLEQGAKLIVIDPRYSATAAKSDIWVKIKPSTDTAMLLAIMNYIIENEKYDKEFIAERGEGFDEFTEHVKEWTLEKAAKVCDIPAAQIKQVADMLADNAPNVSIHPGRFASWHGTDFQRGRAMACLTGLLGAIGVPGGLVKPKMPRGLKRKKWPVVEHEIEAINIREELDVYPFSPPGTPTDLIRNAAIYGDPYPIKGCVIWGQNLIQTIPNQPKTIAMLKAMDFVMCTDLIPTDITMYADILLPGSTYLEQYNEIKRGTQWDFADKHQQYIAPRMPLVDPLFEAKDSVWITNELAKRMGFAEYAPVKDQVEYANKFMEGAGVTIEQIRKKDGIHLQPGEDPYGVPEDLIIHFFSYDLEDYGFPAMATYIPVEKPPSGYMRLLSGRTPVHTFNRTLNNPWLVHELPENPIWVNDKVAARLDLEDGQRVKCINQDGEESRSTTTVKVTPGIREDSVFLAHGYGSKSPALSVGHHRGVDGQELITRVVVDQESGCHGMRNNFIRLVKV